MNIDREHYTYVYYWFSVWETAAVFRSRGTKFTSHPQWNPQVRRNNLPKQTKC